MGSSIRFDNIEIETGTWFPFQVVISVSFSSSVETQIDSKSKIARLLKKFVVFRNWKIESFQLFKQGFAELIQLLWEDMLHSILASQEMLIEVVWFVEKGFTARAPRALDATIYIICKNDMICNYQ